MTNFDDIAHILAGHEPTLLGAGEPVRAAVALILRVGKGGLDVLFIERASCDDDPWSGDVGFPGGKVEEGEDDPRKTAERETLEELGLDLGSACYLGRLSDIIGAHLPVQVSCFVYGVTGDEQLSLSGEVRDAFWVPMTDLQDPARHGEAAVRFGDEPFARPAIRLPQPGKPVLWGITYRLIMQFLELLQGE